MENKRKLLLYRSWHRGCKETDLLLGNFAKANIESMTEEELVQYEIIVGMEDSNLYSVLTADINLNNANLINQIIEFNHKQARNII